MNVVQILMNCVEDVSSIRIFMPKDLRPAVNRNTVKKTVDEVLKRYEGNVPCLDPIEDMKVSVFLFFFSVFLLFSIVFSSCYFSLSCHFLPFSFYPNETHSPPNRSRTRRSTRCWRIAPR